MTLENEYPQLLTLKASEIFVEGVRVVKDGKFSVIGIEKVIPRRGWQEMAKALKSQLNADRVYLMTIET